MSASVGHAPAAGVVAAAALAALALPPAIEIGLLVCINLLGIPCCTRAMRMLGRGKDPGAIVYDEFASLPLVLLAVPAAARSPLVLAAACVLHRAFDVTKPFPCRRLEHLPAGLGIMADDWAAAAYAAVCLALGHGWGWL
jgi:phosphatidylglycerophosphatase A